MRSLLLVFSVLIFLMVLPVNAAFTWENNITVGYDTVQWMYTETYTEGNALLYKDYIDMSLGNQDHFISAWEVLKADVKTRSTLENSIHENMDVIINGSSQSVVLTDVSSLMSSELLGPVAQVEAIRNLYTTNYHLVDPLSEPCDSSISFIGEKGTPLLINMSNGTYVDSTEGIDNVSISTDQESIIIRGIFGSTDKATVYFHLDEIQGAVSPVERVTYNILGDAISIDGKEQNSSLAERILPSLGMNNARID
ncbi:hypothetical protein [uncultured Methanomethylovorans sp.]|uniref:hypothetical protein n=1 Tax=uncultured Methanomethylovorans sp. TaxID=183759 RepID=UPI003749909D